MNEQLTMGAAPVVGRPDSGRPTIQERYEQFIEDNPIVYQRIRDMALEDRRHGLTHGAIEWYWQVIRREIAREDLVVRGPWKLNDHFRSRLVRDLMRREPELKDFFETRELRRK